MLRKSIIFFSIVFLVFGGDLLTKKFLITPEIVLYEKQNIIFNHILLFGSMLMFVLAPLGKKYGYLIAVVAAGGIANTFDSLDGNIQNPFIIFFGNKIMGFNFADVVVSISLVVFLVVVVYDRLFSTFGNSSVDSSAALRTRRS